MPARSSVILSTSWASPSDKTMEKAKVERINYLARESKVRELTAEEKAEQAELRKAYLKKFREGMENTLNSVYIMDENGNKKKVEKKK